VPNLDTGRDLPIQELKAIRGKSGPDFIDVGRIGNVPFVRAVGPHHEQIPIAARSLSAVKDPAFRCHLLCQLRGLRIGGEQRSGEKRHKTTHQHHCW
jgi:hypothetical protein